MNEYKCLECGCEEFISKPNQYEVFEYQNGKLLFAKAEFVNEQLKLFCRDCSEELSFDDKDVVYELI